MNNVYLIPANSKKSQLILGFFTMVDIILFTSGCALTLLLLMLVQNASPLQMAIILMPAVVTGFLVMPIMYYHNVLQFIINVCNYLFNTRRYYWRGWCVKDGSEVK